MDPSLASPVVAWLASDKAAHVTGQIIRAVGDEIVLMEPWSNGNTVSKPGQALGGRELTRRHEHRHLPLPRPGPALLSPARNCRHAGSRRRSLARTDSTGADLLGRCLRRSGRRGSSARRRPGISGVPGLRMSWSKIRRSPSCSPTRAVASVAARVSRCSPGAAAAWLPAGRHGRGARRRGRRRSADRAGGVGRRRGVRGRRVRAWISTSTRRRPDLEPVKLDGEVQASTLATDMAGVCMVVVGGPGVVRHDAVARAARGRGAPRRRRGQHLGREGRVPLGQPVPSRHGRAAGARRRAGRADLGGARDRHRARLGRDAGRVVGERSGARRRPASARGADLPMGCLQPRAGRSALYEQLSAALQPLYASATVPLSPARAAADLGAHAGLGRLVLADPGPAGLWVARAFPTTELGSVVVPALPVGGFALAGAHRGVVGRPSGGRRGRRPRRPSHGRAARSGRALGRRRHARGLGRRRRLPSPRGAVERLAEALEQPGLAVLPLPVDFAGRRAGRRGRPGGGVGAGPRHSGSGNGNGSR